MNIITLDCMRSKLNSAQACERTVLSVRPQLVAPRFEMSTNPKKAPVGVRAADTM